LSRTAPVALRERCPHEWFRIRESIHVADWLAVRERHYARQFGPIVDPIFHPDDDRRPHVDVYQFQPRPGHAYWTLITAGMSSYPQIVSVGYDQGVSTRVEILM
jgi:hypothetical protein